MKGHQVLVIDIGGNNVKMLATGQKEPRKFESGPTLSPKKMVVGVKKTTADWDYDVISIGYPGLVLHGEIKREPKNLASGWVGFDFEKAFGRPVKIVNDAAMQAIGSYKGGRMLFLGLGTGLGSAMVVNGVLEPMELAHLPYRNGKTFEDYVGQRGLERLGKNKCVKHVFNVIDTLRAALEPDYVILGGGNVKRIKDLPAGIRAGSNENAFWGGWRMWEVSETGTPDPTQKFVLH
ncbi:MAG: ROK family protein [Acidobacteria bacterium]|nr:MAG: ROK family protein [Acidobacteriota bacterium]